LEATSLSLATPGQPHLALALGFWAIWYSSDVPEADRYIKEAYEIAEKQGNARVRALVLWQYGGIEMRRNHFEFANKLLQESLGLFKCLKERHFSALSLLILGRVATRQAYFDVATRNGEEALQILGDLSDRGCSVECLFHLGWNALLAGEIDHADHYFQVSLSICQEFDLSDLSVLPIFALGQLAVLKKDLPSAKNYLMEALQENKKTIGSSDYFLAYCLEAVCSIPGLKPETAARILGKVEAIREQKGYYLSDPERRLVDPHVEELKSRLGTDGYDFEHSAGMALTSEQIIDGAMEALQAVDL